MGAEPSSIPEPDRQEPREERKARYLAALRSDPSFAEMVEASEEPESGISLDELLRRIPDLR